MCVHVLHYEVYKISLMLMFVTFIKHKFMIDLKFYVCDIPGVTFDSNIQNDISHFDVDHKCRIILIVFVAETGYTYDLISVHKNSW